MESWSYVAEGKGFASDGAVSNTDAIARGKRGLMGCELRTPVNYGSNMGILSRGATENQGFVELGFSEIMRKSFLNDQIRGVFSCNSGSGRTPGSTMAIPNAFSGEEESSSKPSSSVVESSSRDTSFIDLKLGGLADNRDTQNLSSNQESPILSSSESSSPAKRVRASGSTSQAPFCLVHGCKKDLGSSKEYYRRHKVCEIHSKTSKVIVSGIEQRFCQQCSRFHLLAEFDDGKRSCRKRLACHNERRRKPHVGILSGRAGSADSRFLGSTLITSSFICQDILPSSFVHPSKYETGDTCRRVKTEDRADYSFPSAIPIRNEYLHPKSVLPSHSYEKHFPKSDNGFSAATGKDFHENCNQNPNDLMGPYSVSRYFFQNTPIGSEDLTIFNSASTIQGLSTSGRALSLLSSQSQNSSSHSSGVPISQPLFLPGSNNHYNANQVSEKFLGVSSQALTTGMSNRFHFPKTNSVEDNHLSPILISDGSNAVNFEITDGVFPGSEYLNAKDSSGDGPTIDLLQLSSQLQRVEHQRYSMQVKQERDTFCGLKTT